MGDMKQAIEVMKTSAMVKLMRKTDKDTGEAFCIYPYVNGREKGFCVSDQRDWEKNSGRAVTFSECRNSDSLMVYVGREFIWSHERERAVKEGRDISLNFELHDNAVKLTDAIYHKHSYSAWCNRPSLFKMVGVAIAKFLSGKSTEEQLAKDIRDIDKAGKKMLGY
jgi:hypothetical protein